MRAYISSYLTAYLATGWLLSVAGCASEPQPEPYWGSPTLNDERPADAGPTNCDLQGTWEVTLGTQDDCSPEEAGAVVILTVDEHGTDNADFTYAELPPTSPCGEYKHEVEVSGNGCTINASSQASWCSADRPQCRDYELTLHVHGEEADVEGTYRRCWCGSPSAFGTKVKVAGSGHRR